MIKTIFLSVMLTSYVGIQSALSQFKNYNTENEQWFSGRVKLLGGKTIDGELNYNFVSQVLRLRKTDKIEIYNAEEVLLFLLEKSDEEPNLYYSLPYMDQEYGRKRAVFFEVLYENNELAILSRLIFEFKDRNWLFDSNTNNPLSTVPPTDYKIEKVWERIYMANTKGTIRPYMEGKKSKNLSSTFGFNEGSSRADGKSTLKYNESKFKKSKADKEVRRYRLINKNVLSEFFDSEYYDVQDYINESNVELNTIEGLVEVFDFYANLKKSD
ncbi:MAG: hypothetical protein AAGA02_12925 [Bacteroidota bacterium]